MELATRLTLPARSLHNWVTNMSARVHESIKAATREIQARQPTVLIWLRQQELQKTNAQTTTTTETNLQDIDETNHTKTSDDESTTTKEDDNTTQERSNDTSQSENRNTLQSAVMNKVETNQQTDRNQHTKKTRQTKARQTNKRKSNLKKIIKKPSPGPDSDNGTCH